MSTNKKLAVALMLSMCAVAHAQSIDELSELNRQGMIADAKAKLDKKRDTPAAPQTPGAPGAAMPTAYPPAVDASQSGRPAAATRKVSKSSAPPALIAIYGVAGRLVTELSDAGFQAPYHAGDRTPNGWLVASVEKRAVTVKRPKKGNQFEVVTLPFGIKLDEPKEREKEAVNAQPSNLGMPPIPASFPPLPR